MSAVRDVLDNGLGGIKHNFLTGRIEDLVQWSRSRSSWGATFGLACCAIEMMGTGAPHYDLARFGMEVFRASPRQADIMIVAGRVSQKMGVCASSGGMFNNYAIVQGVDQVVPVDVYAPGCPPTPETLIHAIETLHQLIEDGEIMHRRAATGAGANVHIQEIPAGITTPVTLERR
jgi:NADH-quinone oxidoreductase subunit B